MNELNMSDNKALNRAFGSMKEKVMGVLGKPHAVIISETHTTEKDRERERYRERNLCENLI